MLIYQDKIQGNALAFINKVYDVSNRLNINPNWLMAIMYFESAKTFNPAIQNPYTNATGLIQFMPQTATELGTSIAALKNMSAVEQLEYVYKYYARYKSKLKSYIDLYLTTFFPLAVGKSDDFVLETNNIPASLIANQNPVFDLNNDNVVTVGEIKSVMLEKIPQEWYNIFDNKDNSLAVLLTIGAVLITFYSLTS